jgi:hypothetical protein
VFHEAELVEAPFSQEYQHGVGVPTSTLKYDRPGTCITMFSPYAGLLMGRALRNVFEVTNDNGPIFVQKLIPTKSPGGLR